MQLPKQYEAERMTKNSMTVGDWKSKFKTQYPGYDVVFADVENSKKIPTIEFDGWYLYFSFGQLNKYLLLLQALSDHLLFLHFFINNNIITRILSFKLTFPISYCHWIFEIEGFQVDIAKGGKNVRGDMQLPKQYEAERMTKNSMTVGDWKSTFTAKLSL